MKFPFFTGKRSTPEPKGRENLPWPKRNIQNRPEDYEAADDLIDAVNVALVLGQPLLVTGEPGSGKTQLAYRVAWELGFDEPLKFITKSSSVANDLFYKYDALSRLHAVQSYSCIQPGDQPPEKICFDPVAYMTYNALGLALLRANNEKDVKSCLPEHFVHGGQRRSVVLIDEIDKAPRDFPNDILNEIENMAFRIPELGNVEISAPESMNPVIIITSNSEKHLPDAFLRRCVYYHVEFPENCLESIAQKRLAAFPDLQMPHSQYFLSDAIELFLELRKPTTGLKKRPSTGEFLVWLQSLCRMSGTDNPIIDDSNRLAASLSAMIKSNEDLTISQGVIKEWQPGRIQ